MKTRVLLAIVTGVVFLFAVSTQDLRAAAATHPASAEKLHGIGKAELRRRSLFLNDPADGKRRTVSYETFRRNWEAAQRWTFLIVPR